MDTFSQDGVRHAQAVLNPLLFPEASWVDDFSLFDECNTSVTTSHKSRAGIPSILKPAKEITFDAVELWSLEMNPVDNVDLYCT